MKNNALHSGGIVLVAVACLALGTGCSDDSDQPSANTTTTSEATGPVTTTLPGEDCPFSGDTAPTSGDGQAAGSVISKLTPDVDGCIDNVTIDFSTLPPAWTVGYEPGPFVDATGSPVTVPGPETLVVTFTGTTYPDLTGGSTTPVTIPTSSSNYVAGVTAISTTNGSLQFVISLPEQLPYITSQSNVPSNFVLSIG